MVTLSPDRVGIGVSVGTGELVGCLGGIGVAEGCGVVEEPVVSEAWAVQAARMKSIPAASRECRIFLENEYCALMMQDVIIESGKAHLYRCWKAG
jgi:hypothetical protein